MPGLHVIEFTATVLVPHPKPTPVQIAFGIRSVDETDVVTDSLTGLAVQIQASFKAKNDFFFWYEYYGNVGFIVQTANFIAHSNEHVLIVCNCTAGTGSICSTNMVFHKLHTPASVFH